MSTDRVTLSVRDAEALTGIGQGRIHTAIKRGDLIAKRLGATILIRPVDLDAWVDGLPSAADEA